MSKIKMNDKTKVVLWAYTSWCQQYLEKIICSLKIEIKDSILFKILIISTHNSLISRYYMLFL